MCGKYDELKYFNANRNARLTGEKPKRVSLDSIFTDPFAHAALDSNLSIPRKFSAGAFDFD